MSKQRNGRDTPDTTAPASGLAGWHPLEEHALAADYLGVSLSDAQVCRLLIYLRMLQDHVDGCAYGRIMARVNRVPLPPWWGKGWWPDDKGES